VRAAAAMTLFYVWAAVWVLFGLYLIFAPDGAV
jgi:hypothetical protein